MKKALFFVLALAAICIMPSCTKDPAQNKVVFGNSKGMSVTSYEGIPLVQQYSHMSWGYTVDLNDDGKEDVQFHSENIGSPAVGRDIVTTLKCQHENIELLGDIINQEKYLHIDSTFQTEDNIHWTIGVYSKYTCEQIAETDSVVSTTEKLSLFANNAGDSFDENDSFKNIEVILKNRSYNIPYGSETIGDTTYFYMEEIKNDCDVFPMDEAKYIGFKITENNKSRLGWMKVILHQDHVELLETAIQK